MDRGYSYHVQPQEWETSYTIGMINEDDDDDIPKNETTLPIDSVTTSNTANFNYIIFIVAAFLDSF